jgi:hypothetical protein
LRILSSNPGVYAEYRQSYAEAAFARDLPFRRYRSAHGVAFNVQTVRSLAGSVIRQVIFVPRAWAMFAHRAPSSTFTE